MLGICVLILPLMFLGCEGDDGAQGPQGIQGPEGPPGTGAAAQAESCSICHGGNPEADGADHQAYYDSLYQDGVIQVAGLGVAYTAPNIVTTTFTMTKDASPFNCEDADSVGIYFTTYTGTSFEQAGRLGLKPSDRTTPSGTTTTVGDSGTGLCTVTATFTDPLADFTGTDGLIVVYGRDETLGTLPVRVNQAKYPFAALLPTGTFAIGDYTSAANVAGCEKCHTVPFLKHGYIYGTVDADPATQFYTCKACHLDNGEGGHQIWQVLVDDPQLAGDLYAQSAAAGTPGEDLEDYLTPAQLVQYAYTTRLMNDVHMSHAMEFPYPQSMANCATCHEGKLTTAVLTDANFELETCKSCHPVTGGTDLPDGDGDFTADTTGIALETIIPHGFDDATVCNDCHKVGGIAPVFSEIHTGYNPIIYADAAGTKLADEITVSIDNATLVGTDLTIGISSAGAAGGLDSADITPAVLVGLYGYNTKDFIVNGHDRWDSNCNGTISRSDGDQPIGEYVVGEEVEGCPNPYWTLVSGGPGAGPWVITAHLATWADMIDDGTIKNVEIAALPELENADGEQVGLNAVSRTFVLATGAFDDDFFGHNIVDVNNCNNCHDQLATTFHSGDRGGSVTVCRMCHVTLTGGSHLEMQSRSIDSYVHAIHSFQAFDIGDIDFSDPYEALEYGLHIEIVHPTLGIRNCESCHKPGTYNVPDQTKSLPGVLSGSDFPVIFYDGLQRNIGEVPSYITGPAARACGACHRAHEINEDEAGELASLFSHWGSFGTLVEDGDIQTVIEDIFSAL